MLHWVDGSYQGPRVRYTPESRSRVLARLNHWVCQRTEELYEEAVRRWAAEDEGPFPERVVLTEVAQREVEVLCHALGPWAAVDPGSVLGPHPDLDFLVRGLRGGGWGGA